MGLRNKRVCFVAILFSLLLSSCSSVDGGSDVITSLSDYNTTINVSEDVIETSTAELTSNSNELVSIATEVTTGETTVVTTTVEHTVSTIEEPFLVDTEEVTEVKINISTAPPVVAVKTEQHIVTTTTTATPAVTPVPIVETPAEPSPAIVPSIDVGGDLNVTNNKGVIDYNHTNDGYVAVKYTGSKSTIKVRVTNPDSTNQVYTLKNLGSYESIPLTGGNGNYTVMIGETLGSMFSPVVTGKFNVVLSSSLAPYYRSSNYVPFAYGDSAVTKASQLCGGAKSDLEKVDRVYSWLVDNVDYDYALAESVKAGYVMDSEKVINRRIGICLDYAGTMTAMLRSQGIPTQLAVGYAGDAYHAWVNVYLTEIGWVYGAIYFDGSAWHRMDPTFAATSNSSGTILKYIGDGSNYTVQYVY